MRLSMYCHFICILTNFLNNIYFFISCTCTSFRSHHYGSRTLTASELLFVQVAKLQAVEVGGENADCIIANLYGVAFSPGEQPRQLAVAEQSVTAEVPGENRA